MPTASHPKRTEQEIIASNDTLIMLAEKHKKPCLQIDFSEEIIYGATVHTVDWIQALKDSSHLSKSEAEAVIKLFFVKIAKALVQRERFESRGPCSFFVKK